MLKAYKYRIYPTEKQKELLNKHIGSCRFIYNLALETKNNAYASHRKNLSCFELMRQLTQLKKDYEWLREVDSQALQQSLINLDKAFTSFFKGQAKFPNFKKKAGTQSFRNPHGEETKIKNGKLYQAKFRDGIKLVQDRFFNGDIRRTTISKTPTGKYFVSVLVENHKANPIPKTPKVEDSIGIDLGLKDFIVDSNGIKYTHPKHFQKALTKLKYLSRQASKKKKGSQNKKKAYFKLAIHHEKIANQRKDFLHTLSSKIISENQTVCVEDLNISGMVKNQNLSQSISSSGWGMFVSMLKYKAEWKGKNVLQIPTFEPSTKLCNKCGATNHTLTLADREWLCVNCATMHDRDTNAAINIKNYCLKNYCGGQHRKKSVELPTMAGAMKQKNS